MTLAHMTPRERVERVLRGGRADRVPFTMYENKLPQCRAERDLRNRGLCIVDRRVKVVTALRPNVKSTETRSTQDGRPLVRTTHETPVGAVSMVREPAGFTSWFRERLFKGPEDYKVLRFLIDDEVFAPCYRPFVDARRAWGGDAILRPQLAGEPLQVLISNWMGTEAFCYEWMDRRDEVLDLYHALVAHHRKVYPLVAASPALHANYGGNVVPEIVGLEGFETYYVPNYNEAAEHMHAHGKLVGSHLDANCGVLKHAIARTALDYIEAFTPAPDTDLTLAEARAAWPDKVLWLNFPSSVHLRPDEEVERFTFDLLEELDTVDGLLMGITEDIPPDRWQGSCRAIMDGLDRHAAERPELYAR